MSTDARSSVIDIPKSGMIVPEMGRQSRKTSRAGLAGALFTPVQQRVLGLLFGQPDRSYQSAELIRLAGSGVGAVHRQLARLEAVGLLEVTRTGNQKHYRARRDSAVFDELRGLIIKTVGMADPLRNALSSRVKSIHAAFVYGSVAKGSDRAKSDVDVMVLSEDLSYAEVFELLQGAEAVIGRTVNPTVMTLAQWRAKKGRADSFAARVAAQPKVFVMGSEDAIA
jgi:predicted nucleotidyltransferase